jgi:hypothetical protein
MGDNVILLFRGQSQMEGIGNEIKTFCRVINVSGNLLLNHLRFTPEGQII